MNSLPPELLSSIIEQAAQCDSTYDSYRSRLSALSSFSLVNRTFRNLAQPLLPQKVWFRKDDELEGLLASERRKEVNSLTYEREQREICPNSLQGFRFMRELRIRNAGIFDIAAIDQHQHLKRLALDSISVLLKTHFSDFALSRLEELSLANVGIYDVISGATSTTSSFLAPSHFPSLRALGIRSLGCFVLTGDGNFTIAPLGYSLISELDCVLLDEREQQAWIRSRQPSPGSSLSDSSSVPLLLDVDTTPPFDAPSATAYTSSHIRLRLVADSFKDEEARSRAISLVEALLTQSTTIKELYLDIGSHGGKEAHGSDKDLNGRIEKVEQLAERKKVEVIWENHEDDWCKSLVSKEFWRRSKENKEKAKERE